MRVLISVDLEGIAGVVCPVETQLEGIEYEKARALMTAEASAAAEAAHAAGVDDIIIADAHGHMRNLLVEALPEYVRIVRGAPRPLCMVQGLGAGIDAAMFIGYHARAGTSSGIMNHSFLGRVISAVRLNDVLVGEVGFNAAVAGAFAVPVILVSGDAALAREVADLLPRAERVVVKDGVTSWSASSITPAAARAAIGAGVRTALARLDEMTPLRMESPTTVQVDFFRPLQADLAAIIPGVTRNGPLTVSYTGTDMLDANRAFQTMLLVTAAAKDGYG